MIANTPADVSDERVAFLDNLLNEKAEAFGFTPEQIENDGQRGWTGSGAKLVRMLRIGSKTFTSGVNVKYNKKRPVRQASSSSTTATAQDALVSAMKRLYQAKHDLEKLGVEVDLKIG